MFLLHLFSGRRRVEDFQHHFEMNVRGCNLIVRSIDVQIDPDKGHLTKPDAIAFLCAAICQGKIFGIVAGPPCETWCSSRWRATEGKAPRPLRTRDFPWGIQASNQTELQQLALADELYRTAVLLITT
eukprot:8007777-Pyramimonas_sp.AAC.1